MRLFRGHRYIKSTINSVRRLFSNKFIYGDEVIAAKRNNVPIVALESTIITHGMPYPDNFKTAVRVEKIIRDQGAVPATIGIINGNVHVGIDQERIEKLAAEAGGPVSAVKCSQRDICSIVAAQRNGGTTVGGTITIAHRAGISVMATGGIGGVHRGATETFDISSDLIVLSRTPVAVVCAGVKAILDIPKTLELLETLGVPVVTIGTDTFPAFYSSRTSDAIKSPAKVDDALAAAKCMHSQRDMEINSGLIFAVPIPESVSLDPTAIEKFIHEALQESEARGIRGKDVTPYLLRRVTELTEGKSLAANKVLIENNARVAADIAIELVKLSRRDAAPIDLPHRGLQAAPVVIGGAVLDAVLHIEDPVVRFDGRTHAGRSSSSHGGVGRNIAAALVALGLEGTRFISVVGDDDAGRGIVDNLRTAGQTVTKLSDQITARYTGLIDCNGECIFGIGEMDIFAKIDTSLIQRNRSVLEQAQLVILDGNPPLETMEEVIDIALNCHIPVWYEPTDVKKACKIFQANSKWSDVLRFVSPNVKELFAMAKYFAITNCDTAPKEEEFEIVKNVTEKLAEHIPNIITTMGAKGVLVTRKSSKELPFYDPSASDILLFQGNGEIQSRLYPPLFKKDKNTPKYSVSGCGDCLAAGIIVGMLKGLDEMSCVALGLQAASISLKSVESTPKALKTLKARNILYK